MRVARVEAERDASAGLVEQHVLTPDRPLAGERPMVERQPRRNRVRAAFVPRGAVRRRQDRPVGSAVSFSESPPRRNEREVGVVRPAAPEELGCLRAPEDVLACRRERARTRLPHAPENEQREREEENERPDKRRYADHEENRQRK